MKSIGCVPLLAVIVVSLRLPESDEIIGNEVGKNDSLLVDGARAANSSKDTSLAQRVAKSSRLKLVAPKDADSDAPKDVDNEKQADESDLPMCDACSIEGNWSGFHRDGTPWNFTIVDVAKWPQRFFGTELLRVIDPAISDKSNELNYVSPRRWRLVTSDERIRFERGECSSVSTCRIGVGSMQQSFKRPGEEKYGHNQTAVMVSKCQKDYSCPKLANKARSHAICYGLTQILALILILLLRKPDGRLGLKSIFCVCCCAPLGCLAICMPLDDGEKVGEAVTTASAESANIGAGG